MSGQSLHAEYFDAESTPRFGIVGGDGPAEWEALRGARGERQREAAASLGAGDQRRRREGVLMVQWESRKKGQARRSGNQEYFGFCSDDEEIRCTHLGWVWVWWETGSEWVSVVLCERGAVLYGRRGEGELGEQKRGIA